MGSSVVESGRFGNESPRHEVLIARRIAIGRGELTQGEWRALMDSNPSRFGQCGDTCPVEMVSREEAREFARRLSKLTGATYRLPSEAEWEYACRGGNDSRYCGGELADAVAWHAGNARQPRPSRERQANALGLYDLSGNVAEWVDDCWVADYLDAPADGSSRTQGGRCDVPILRGGSWATEERYLRAAQRVRASIEIPRGSTIGFRLVRELR